MNNEETTIPEHYRLLAQELKPLIAEIRDAFINRPVPSGPPIADLHDFIAPFADKSETALKKLTQALRNIPGCKATDESDITPEGVKRAFARVQEQVRVFIGLFHSIWLRPFPVPYADGQPLVSAMAENILRQCLNIFEKIVDIAENPRDVIRKYGDTRVTLSFSHNDKEAQRFVQWINERKAALAQASCEQKPRRKWTRWLWLLLLPFAFSGSDSKKEESDGL